MYECTIKGRELDAKTDIASRRKAEPPVEQSISSDGVDIRALTPIAFSEPPPDAFVESSPVGLYSWSR